MPGETIDVDPGTGPADPTTIKVTYYDVVGVDGRLVPFETFTLSRPRGDRVGAAPASPP